MKGTVKWFNRSRGYGFIDGEDNKDYFVHSTQVPEKTFLREGDKVVFEPKEGDRGLQAVNVDIDRE